MIVGSVTARTWDFVKSLRSLAAATTTIDCTALPGSGKL